MRESSTSSGNIRDWLQRAEAHLVSHGVPNARRNAEWMLCYSMGCNMLDVYVKSGDTLDAGVAARYWEIVERRAGREPLQYILEGTEFMSLPFSVRPGVFVPRPETELLVELAESQLRSRPLHESISVADLCCGSGIIGISLAVRVPNLDVTAVDSSPLAAGVTAANAHRNAVAARVRAVEIDACEFLAVGSTMFSGIVCNPPYIATSELSALPREVREHEPVAALDGGADGLDFYRRCIPLLARRLQADGFVMFEIGHTQARAVSELLRKAGFGSVDVAQDLAGHDRVVTATTA